MFSSFLKPSPECPVCRQRCSVTQLCHRVSFAVHKLFLSNMEVRLQQRIYTVVPEVPGFLLLTDLISHKMVCPNRRHTHRSRKSVDSGLHSLFFTSEETKAHYDLRPSYQGHRVSNVCQKWFKKQISSFLTPKSYKEKKENICEGKTYEFVSYSFHFKIHVYVKTSCCIP